jgi:hypothetical protein
VEAAVERVVVLARAVLAHGEAAHGGERPVVGERLDDRVARPAVGAVDERVAVPAVGRVAHLAQAVVAHRQVGRDRGRDVAGVLALDDDEAPSGRRGPARAALELGHRLDARGRRRLGGDGGGEGSSTSASPATSIVTP